MKNSELLQECRWLSRAETGEAFKAKPHGEPDRCSRRGRSFPGFLRVEDLPHVEFPEKIEADDLVILDIQDEPVAVGQ
jgi:hypothetical protein